MGAEDKLIRTEFANEDGLIRTEFANADGLIRTEFANADGLIRTEFANADTKIGTDYKAADTAITDLMNKDDAEVRRAVIELMEAKNATLKAQYLTGDAETKLAIIQ